MTEHDNVIAFPKKKIAIFSDKQKARLVTSIRDLTPTPETAVDRIEHDLCSQFVETTREAASMLGEKLAQKLTNLLFK